MDYVDLSDSVISVDKVGGYWRVFWNGRVCRTFTCADAETRAQGYALAMLDGRPLRGPLAEIGR